MMTKLKKVNSGDIMIQKYLRTLATVLSCAILASCSGERRVDGEMPFDSDSLITMAESFLTAGDYASALRLYQRAANENPNHIPSRLGLAKTYQGMGAIDAAINFYEQILRIDPNNKDAKLGKAQMLITKNRPAEAIPYLSDLLKTDVNNYRIHNMIGLAYDLMGKQEDAQMNYGRGLTIAVDNISLLNNLALSFAFEEQYAPSLKLLTKAIYLDHTVTKAQHNLVLVYVLSGDDAAGRRIGSAIMTSEELETNIHQYKWVKTLSAGQRAQAIFLGIKDFPKETEQGPVVGIGRKKMPETPVLSNDPKKRQLQELLRQEETGQKKNNKNSEYKKTKPVKTNAQQQKIYRVQLGSYPTTKLAYSGWQKIKSKSKGILDAYVPGIKLVKLADGKNLFRLFIGSIEAKSLAETLCAELRYNNVDCLVLKTAKD